MIAVTAPYFLGANWVYQTVTFDEATWMVTFYFAKLARAGALGPSGETNTAAYLSRVSTRCSISSNRAGEYLKLLRHPIARGVAACLAAASLAGVVSFLANRPVAHAASQVASAPFSATTVQSFFGPEGKLGFKESREYYRFRDWSVASRETEIYPEQRQLLGGAVDLALEHDLILEPITRSVITMKKNRAQQLSFLTGLEDETCPDDSDNVVASEPGGLILGYATTHVTTKNCWKEDRWLIPKLRCFAVKEIQTFSDGGRNEFETTSLIEGEPSRSLLSAPNDYVERSPAETAKAFALARGGEELFGSRRLAVLTKEYAVGR